MKTISVRDLQKHIKEVALKPAMNARGEWTLNLCRPLPYRVRHLPATGRTPTPPEVMISAR